MSDRSTDARTLERIAHIVDKKKPLIKLSLKACVHCAICADSCFLYRQHNGDPTYTPSYKAINSIGKIYRKKGRLSDAEYESVRELAWDKCVLCTRCYCPLGINLPSLIATARAACRERGVHRWYTTRKNA
jgi:Fe-S oxidoreductase